MRTGFARGSSHATALEFPTESQPWAQRHVTCIELRAFIFRISSEQSLHDPFGTRHDPHTRMYAWRGKGWGKGTQGK